MKYGVTEVNAHKKSDANEINNPLILCYFFHDQWIFDSAIIIHSKYLKTSYDRYIKVQSQRDVFGQFGQQIRSIIDVTFFRNFKIRLF